jgi:hypothetical protein
MLMVIISGESMKVLIMNQQPVPNVSLPQRILD